MDLHFPSSRRVFFFDGVHLNYVLRTTIDSYIPYASAFCMCVIKHIPPEQGSHITIRHSFHHLPPPPLSPTHISRCYLKTTEFFIYGILPPELKRQTNIVRHTKCCSFENHVQAVKLGHTHTHTHLSPLSASELMSE